MKNTYLLLLLTLFVTPLFATPATVDSSRSSFRACYLTSEDTRENLAVLYRGAELNLIEQASNGRWKVSVDSSSSLVRPYGQASGELVGWISDNFVKQQEAEDNQDQPQDQNTGQPAGNMDLLGQRTNTSAGSGQSNPEPETSPAGSGVYYLFTSEGNDSEWFDFLASNGRPAGKKNNVWGFIKKDIQASGNTCEGVAVIRVAKPEDIMDVLTKGSIPTQGLSRLPSYQRVKIRTMAELTPSAKKIIGFGVIAHSGSEGPLLNYGQSRNSETGELVGLQMHWTYFRKDMLKALKETTNQNTVGNRLLEKSRIRFFGCNSGHCGYWKARPSICHHLAAVYQSKKAVVSGRLVSGSPNAAGSWADFGLNDKKLATRLTPDKKDYKLLINTPKKAYDRFTVPAKDDEERQAILEYYQSRDITVSSRTDGVYVRAPSSKWLTRASKKDNLLKAVVLALASGDEAVIADTKAKMPHVAKIIDNTRLRQVIAQVKEDNNGTLDMNDGRIWFQIYYWSLTSEQRKWKCARRNCSCQDCHLTNDWKTKSKDSYRKARVHSD